MEVTRTSLELIHKTMNSWPEIKPWITEKEAENALAKVSLGTSGGGQFLEHGMRLYPSVLSGPRLGFAYLCGVTCPYLVTCT